MDGSGWYDELQAAMKARDHAQGSVVRWQQRVEEAEARIRELVASAPPNPATTVPAAQATSTTLTQVPEVTYVNA